VNLCFFFGVPVHTLLPRLVNKHAPSYALEDTGSDWETFAQRRTIARLCALFKAYCGERAWKAIRDRLGRAYCLSRVDHVRKIRNSKQRTDIGKYSFVNRVVGLRKTTLYAPM
jgi:hypothetical protein